MQIVWQHRWVGVLSATWSFIHPLNTPLNPYLSIPCYQCRNIALYQCPSLHPSQSLPLHTLTLSLRQPPPPQVAYLTERHASANVEVSACLTSLNTLPLIPPPLNPPSLSTPLPHLPSASLNLPTFNSPQPPHPPLTPLSLPATPPPPTFPSPPPSPSLSTGGCVSARQGRWVAYAGPVPAC